MPSTALERIILPKAAKRSGMQDDAGLCGFRQFQALVSSFSQRLKVRKQRLKLPATAESRMIVHHAVLSSSRRDDPLQSRG
eukprot:9839793-Alexandrium_andersonii.AAC.1